MILEISCIALGVPVGHFLKNNKVANIFAQKTTSYAIKALLFLLGLALGANDKLVSKFDVLGVQAITLSLFIILGSIIGAILADKYLKIDKIFNKEQG